MSRPPRALRDVPTHTLQALLETVKVGRLACPCTATGLRAAGYGHHAAELAAILEGANAEGVVAVLTVAIAERVHRPPPHLDLVWTGPEARTSATRDTAVVVRRLFEGARESVIVGGYSFDSGEDMFRPLHRVMVDHGVQCTFFLDIEGHADDASKADAYAVSKIDRFFVDNWPFGQPRPNVYYDPRTVLKGPPWASLHAKCVVVDQRLSLIGSANFTERGHERNVEAGVLIEDEDFARMLAGQWQSLIDSAAVRRYTG